MFRNLARLVTLIFKAVPRKLILSIATIGVVLIFVYAAAAQNALINGTVTDASGALVQHAKVTATNTATNIARSAETGTAGVYSITELVPGPYQVVIEVAGFKAVKFAALTLTVDQAVTLNAKLQVGNIQEEVSVIGEAPFIDTTDAQVSTVVDQEQMQALPLITRDPYQLIYLSPGVTIDDAPNGGPSVGGARGRNNNFMLDGADNNNTDVAGNITTQNPDSAAEFRVITNNFAPEYGRNNGAVIDVITRSGTNRLHGDVFYFGRWDAMGARDYFNHVAFTPSGVVTQPKNPYERNLYGASLGGPIIKDKTFFFVNYQGNRYITTRAGVATLPTPAFKTGVFTFNNTQPGGQVRLSTSCLGLAPITRPAWVLIRSCKRYSRFIPIPRTSIRMG